MKKLLIANRGEIARRVIRTARRMGINTVAVYSEPDATALHVREAHSAVALGGAASADSYLRSDKLIAAARASGADALHPGYGFLSENADFAQAVLDAGLIWVGPPPAAIQALGNKSAAKALAQKHGVPILPGYFGAEQSDAELQAQAKRLGLPLMVKAAAGGGGRGMRLVTDWQQLAAAIRSARSEAQAAFACGDLLLERALLAPRHIEVQVFADTHGHCVHLGERDCSVQRRHQKLIEETPSPAVSESLRQRMGQCAIDLAQAAAYVGAGTVEFLLDNSAGDESFFLMEMNTRLQVEHPVTEMVTGLDLVEWQLRVARGEALPLSQAQIQRQGHAIEVRLCAEDDSFRPHSGTVRHLRWPEGVRIDHALYEGMVVPPHYDSMLGKLIAHAPSRAQALAQLAGALDQLQVLGLATNRALLAACLRHPQFQAGQALIPFLAEQGDALRAALHQQEQTALEACALTAIYASSAPPQPQADDHDHADDHTDDTLTRSLACPLTRPTRLEHRGQRLELARAGAVSAAPGVVAVALGPQRWHAQRGGVDVFFDDVSFQPARSGAGASAAAQLCAPFNGKVVAVNAVAATQVTRGQVLVVIESMKLEHSLAASAAATVREVHVTPGQQVAPGQLLVSLEPQP